MYHTTMENTMKPFVRPSVRQNKAPRHHISFGKRVMVVSSCETNGRRGTVTDITAKRICVAIDGSTNIHQYRAKSLQLLRDQGTTAKSKYSHDHDIVPSDEVEQPYYYDPREYSMEPMPTETYKMFRLRRIREALVCGLDDDRKLQTEVDAMERSDDFPEELSIAQCLANEYDIPLWVIHDLIPNYERLMQRDQYLRQENITTMVQQEELRRYAYPAHGVYNPDNR
jgi:hypothetical protein